MEKDNSDNSDYSKNIIYRVVSITKFYDDLIMARGKNIKI